MLKLYCQKCGALNAYVSEKPNFCQKCGFNFNPQAQAAIQVEQPQAAEALEAEDEDVVIQGLSFNLSALDVDIESGNSGTEVIGNIAGQLNKTQLKKSLKDNSIPSNADISYSEEDFKREAGNIRGGNEAEET